MATKKIRKNRLNSDGVFDVIHYETSADVVLMADGANVEDHLANLIDLDTIDAICNEETGVDVVTMNEGVF